MLYSSSTNSKESFNVEDVKRKFNLPEQFTDIVLTSSDCSVFLNNFYGDNHNIIDDILDFREYKIFTNRIEYSDFSEMCMQEGLLHSFRHTFLQHFSEESIELIEMRISDGSITLREVFDKFKKNPNINIMRYIL